MPKTPTHPESEAAAIEVFIADVAAIVRRMPVSEARPFLRGLLALVVEHELPELRTAYQALCASDAQLELLAGPQSRLPFA